MTEAEKTYWDTVGPIFREVSIYDGPKPFLKAYGALPEHVGHLLAAHWCASEVCNGGFDQFFNNSTGVLGPEAAAGFRAIGMPESADLVEKAMAVFGENYPRVRSTRRKALKRAPDSHKLIGYEERFFKLMDEEEGGFSAAADRYAARFG